ncbi:MAG: AAA family ATPase [Lachnospiraceae bacterium]|nr:AAA family ATPase [Lachnospiraceae bacterium]
MKISRIKIKNLFGICEYETDGKNLELTGTNGVGKTSILDAIKYALTNRSDRKYIVRDGETEGEIIIETDTGLVIDRKSRIGQTDYKSVKQNGMTVNSPEAFLKDIITPLQLSPVEFMAMDEKAQNALILNMLDYPWNMETIKGWFGEIPQDVNYDQNILAVLNDIQAENGTYYMTRQDINRDIRSKRAIIEEIGTSLPTDYDGARWEKENLSELYTKIERIRKDNETIEKAKRLKESRDNKIRSFEADKEIALAALDREMSARKTDLESELSSLKERILALEKEKDGLSEIKKDKESVINSEYEKKVAQYDSEIAAYEEYADKETKPINDLITKATETEKMKSHVNEWKRMLTLEEEVGELAKKSSSLTEKIEKARTLPGEILETAKIPIAGLSVKNGIPLINGLPVSNLSEGEKLDLCIDVTIQNPAGLQIILIDGIEKLSTNMRERLYSKCKEKGIQFISTRTTDSEDLTIVEV